MSGKKTFQISLLPFFVRYLNEVHLKAWTPNRFERDSEKTSHSSSQCYKHIFGGNLDLPKTNEFELVWPDEWTCIKMLRDGGSHTKIYSKTVNFLRPNSYCFIWGGNLYFRKRLYYIDHVGRYLLFTLAYVSHEISIPYFSTWTIPRKIDECR